jgi:hypothetical protein
MNLERLAIVAPREPREFWAFAEIVYDGGPVAAALWLDDYPTNPPDDGAGVESAASIMDAGPNQRGWLFWAVGDEAQAATAEDPFRPLVHVYGSQISAAGAIRQALATLADRIQPSGSYVDTAEQVTAMLEAEGVEYLMVPDSAAVPVGSPA